MRYRYTLELDVDEDVFCGALEEQLRCAILDLADDFDGIYQNLGVMCEDEYCIKRNDKRSKA